MESPFSKRVLSFDVGVRNLSFSLLEYTYAPITPTPFNDSPPILQHPWKNLKILHWELVDIISESGSKAKNAKTINIHKMCTMMIDALLRRADLLDGVTDILVEQQPMSRFGGAGGNVGSSRMKIMQHVILTFYEMYNRLKAEKFITFPPPEIHSSSSANKLKCTIDPDNFCSDPDTTRSKTTYKQRKQKAVELCSHVLNLCTVDANLKEVIHDSKKKDDLADCIMQGVYLLQTSAPKTKKKRKRKIQIVDDGNLEKTNPTLKKTRKTGKN